MNYFLKKTPSTWLAAYSGLKTLLQLVIGILILFACAQAAIHIGAVPITLQTVGLLMIGLTYPRKLAVSATMLYLVLGALGAPLFAGYSRGIPILLGPSGGYLVGCIIAAQAMGYLREKFGEGSWIRLLIYGLLGNLLVYISGLAWLTHLIDWPYAIQVGLLPFLLTELCKILVVSLAAYQIKKRNNPKQ